MNNKLDVIYKLMKDEIEDSEKYAYMANAYKMDYPEFAIELCKKADEELKHAMSWHDMCVKEMDMMKAEMLKKNEPVSERTLVKWEIEHENYVEEMNEIKREIAMFKAM